MPELLWRSLMLLLLLLSSSGCGGSLPPEALVSYGRPGDFVLGGMFSMHYSFAAPCDYGLLTESLGQSELMMFAIEQINNRTDLLPNVTLGFDLRDYCGDESIAASVALSLAGVVGLAETGTSPAVLGIVGAGGSSTSIAAALVTSAYGIPVIAYRGSSMELSNKHRFPYFFRTWPSGNLQAGAIVDILNEFGWSYVGMIYSVDSYGIRGAQEVRTLADKHDICLAYSVPIRDSPTEVEIQEIALKILKFNKATVVVFFGHFSSIYDVLEELLVVAPNHTGLTMIFSDAAGSAPTLYKRGLANITEGSIEIRNFYKEVPGFQEYFSDVQTDGDRVSPWLQTLREMCINDNTCPVTISGTRHHVVDAVYAFAAVLDEILREDCAGSKACLVNGTVTGDGVVSRLAGVEFNGVDGAFSFDDRGDPVGKYIVRSVQYVSSTFTSLDVGYWDSRGTSERLSITSQDNLKWRDGVAGGTPPRSICREDCGPGYKLVPQEQKCCYSCQKCPENAVVVNSSECAECDEFYWPIENFTACERIDAASVEWQSAVVVVILIISCIGAVLSIVAGLGLMYYRGHALIKATGRELSWVNIAGLLVTFLGAFIILSYPSRASCFLTDLSVSLCLTLTYAPTILKVNRIYRIFRSGLKTTRRPRLVGPREQLILVLIMTAIQLVISIVSVIVAPSLPTLVQPSKYVNYVEIYCLFGSGFLASCVYNLLLVLVCCYYALKTRKLPSNYNESKFIAVSVYSTLVLCLAAVPAYATATSVLQKVATLCAALLLNAYVTLVCVYLPKLYAARFVQGLDMATDQRGSSSSSTGGTSSSKWSGFSTNRLRMIRVNPAVESACVI